MRSRHRPVAIGVVLALAVIAACGGSDEATTDAATPPEADAPAATAESPAAGREAATGVRLSRVGSFREPVYVAAPPGDRRRVMVVEKNGRIRVVRGGKTLATPFLDLEGEVSTGSEQGLLSMAFAPDYATSKRFYVDFTDRSGDTRVQEFRAASADRADKGSRRELLKVDQPEANHNGGQLQFGPDGYLYIGLGDGGGAGDQHGSRGNGQSLSTLLGKILRISPRPSGGRPYGIPPSNPFRSRAGARPEIYAYGLRNPWRFSFDRRTGDLAIADVGQNAVEEIDFARRGKARGENFGWRVWEGRSRFAGGSAPGAAFPVLTKSHDAGWCSITGGYVVRDPALPSLAGRYVYGDYCQGVLRVARLKLPRAERDRSLGLHVSNLTSFGEDARGRIYVMGQGGGVWRLASR
jgi:glucose/arabinose dehydrogenase